MLFTKYNLKIKRNRILKNQNMQQKLHAYVTNIP